MTRQISDQFLLHDRVYSIWDSVGLGLFRPRRLGLKTTATCTACWRGYLCRYAIRDRRLILDWLGMSLGLFEQGEYYPATGPEINGVRPCTPDDELAFFDNIYEGLGLQIRFTGELCIATDPLQDLLDPFGCEPRWAYGTAHRLLFVRGRFFARANLSPLLELARILSGDRHT